MKPPKLQEKDCTITLKPTPVSPTELLKQHFPLNEDFDALALEDLEDLDADFIEQAHNVVCALARIAKGDVWACCTVTLTATWRSFSVIIEQGSSCSWSDEEEFRGTDSDYEEMVNEALDLLQEKVDQAYEDLRKPVD